MTRSSWPATFLSVAVAGALVLGLRVALVPDLSQPEWQFLPDMAHGPAVQSQSADAATVGGASAGGSTDRPLVPGVVVRDREVFPYGATPEEAERAGRELANPFPPDDAAASARGAVVFARDCAPCHGADGEGEGPAVLRGMVRPPSLRADRAVKLPDGHLFHIVTRGQGNMASYAVQVAPDDRWRVILHVRRLQQGTVR